MKQLLTEYKNNLLSTSDTEGIEKKMIDAISERELKQKWAKMLAAEGIERSSADTTPVRKISGNRSIIIWRYAAGIAASFLFVAVMWQLVGSFSKTSSELADEFLQTNRFESPSVRMGTNEDTKNWEEAKNAYRDAQFEKAIAALEAIPHPSNEQLFYLGLSNLYQDSPNYEKAAYYFRSNLERRESNFKDESRWFLALSLIKMNEKAEAKVLLEQLNKKGGWKSKEAKELLKTL